MKNLFTTLICFLAAACLATVTVTLTPTGSGGAGGGSATNVYLGAGTFFKVTTNNSASWTGNVDTNGLYSWLAGSFDPLGEGTTAAYQATNGFPWGTLYDAAGVGASKAYDATNVLGSNLNAAALKGTIPQGSLPVGVLTNNYAGGVNLSHNLNINDLADNNPFYLEYNSDPNTAWSFSLGSHAFYLSGPGGGNFEFFSQNSSNILSSGNGTLYFAGNGGLLTGIGTNNIDTTFYAKLMSGAGVSGIATANGAGTNTLLVTPAISVPVLPGGELSGQAMLAVNTNDNTVGWLPVPTGGSVPSGLVTNGATAPIVFTNAGIVVTVDTNGVQETNLNAGTYSHYGRTIVEIWTTNRSQGFQQMITPTGEVSYVIGSGVTNILFKPTNGVPTWNGTSIGSGTPAASYLVVSNSTVGAAWYKGPALHQTNTLGNALLAAWLDSFSYPTAVVTNVNLNQVGWAVSNANFGVTVSGVTGDTAINDKYLLTADATANPWLTLVGVTNGYWLCCSNIAGQGVALSGIGQLPLFITDSAQQTNFFAAYFITGPWYATTGITGAVPTVVTLAGYHDIVYTTNITTTTVQSAPAGGKIELGIGQFYVPGGLWVSNGVYWNMVLEGCGINSQIICDSNIFPSAATSGQNYEIHFEPSYVALCFTNFAAHALAVNFSYYQWVHMHDVTGPCWVGCITNSLFQAVWPPAAPGMLGMALGGENCHVMLDNCIGVGAGCADGIDVLSEHVDISHCEIWSCSAYYNIFVIQIIGNNWHTNDTFSMGNIYNPPSAYDMTTGAGIIWSGQGQSSVRDTHIYATMTGIYWNGLGGGGYGTNIFSNVSIEGAYYPLAGKFGAGEGAVMREVFGTGSITNPPAFYSYINANFTNTAYPKGLAYLNGGANALSAATNTLTVSSTGITNNTAFNYLLTITAGTGLAMKDGNGNQFATPVLGDTIPFKPGWRFTGTAVTAQCYQQ